MLKLSSLTQRLLVVIVLVPAGVAAVRAGGWVLTAVVTALLTVAAFEYWRIFRHGNFAPSLGVLVIGTGAMVICRQAFGFEADAPLLAAVVLSALGVQVFAYERGSASAALDFNITVGGVLYLGFLGSFLVALRNLPDGLWWFMTVMPAIWLADGGAYFIGRRFGRRPLAPRVSPHKTWEGYLGGIVTGTLGTVLLSLLWRLNAPGITWEKALLLGFVLSAIGPLGDLAESMIKREFGVKDSGTLLPGHGGMMDRVDSWLWTAAIGFYLIRWLWIP